MPRRPSSFFLRTDTIQKIVDRAHLTHTQFAKHLGVNRSHWSALVNRRRAVSPEIRRALLTSRHTKNFPEHELWEDLSDLSSALLVPRAGVAQPLRSPNHR
ncbi:MAG: hypothetical protein EP330_18810 [Deltaproteobacteria bacterium]|nr:MAG: hypothetical protein EP330_18810 [Deltaproteobacteria bacterium]